MSLICDNRDGILRITLNRPQKFNAITDAMWTQLHQRLSSLESSVRAVVISGAGGSFSAGSDVTGFDADADSPLRSRIETSNEVIAMIYRLPVPTLAKVDGFAGGAGISLALACDFVLATPRSRFAFLFSRLGLSLDTGSSWLLPRLVGERRARGLALLGEDVEAARAAEWGLITRVVDDAAIDSDCEELLGRLTALAAPATAGTKTLLADSWSSELDQALAAETTNQLEVIESGPARAAIEAFNARGD